VHTPLFHFIFAFFTFTFYHFTFYFIFLFRTRLLSIIKLLFFLTKYFYTPLFVVAPSLFNIFIVAARLFPFLNFLKYFSHFHGHSLQAVLFLVYFVTFSHYIQCLEFYSPCHFFQLHLYQKFDPFLTHLTYFSAEHFFFILLY
jgi:hypothetical protein